MQCSSCHNFYDHDKYLPRLLVKCSHNICNICLQSVHKKNIITCPICKISCRCESINNIPKNLALLSVIPVQLCDIHETPKVFCDITKQITCTGCILEQNGIISNLHNLDEAYYIEKKNITNNLLNLMELEICNNNINKKIEEYEEKMSKMFDESQNNISFFYDYIISKISIRKENYLKMNDALNETEKNRLSNIKALIKKQLDFINDYKSNCENFDKDNMLILLRKSFARNELFKLIKPSASPVKEPCKFNDINKNVEVENIIKLLKKMINTTNKEGSKSKVFLSSTNKFQIKLSDSCRNHSSKPIGKNDHICKDFSLSDNNKNKLCAGKKTIISDSSLCEVNKSKRKNEFQRKKSISQVSYSDDNISLDLKQVNKEEKLNDLQDNINKNTNTNQSGILENCRTHRSNITQKKTDEALSIDNVGDTFEDKDTRSKIKNRKMTNHQKITNLHNLKEIVLCKKSACKSKENISHFEYKASDKINSFKENNCQVLASLKNQYNIITSHDYKPNPTVSSNPIQSQSTKNLIKKKCQFLKKEKEISKAKIQLLENHRRKN